jgi:hypothetical protein
VEPTGDEVDRPQETFRPTAPTARARARRDAHGRRGGGTPAPHREGRGHRAAQAALRRFRRSPGRTRCRHPRTYRGDRRDRARSSCARWTSAPDPVARRVGPAAGGRRRGSRVGCRSTRTPSRTRRPRSRRASTPRWTRAREVRPRRRGLGRVPRAGATADGPACSLWAPTRTTTPGDRDAPAGPPRPRRTLKDTPACCESVSSVAGHIGTVHSFALRQLARRRPDRPPDDHDDLRRRTRIGARKLDRAATTRAGREPGGRARLRSTSRVICHWTAGHLARGAGRGLTAAFASFRASKPVAPTNGGLPRPSAALLEGVPHPECALVAPARAQVLSATRPAAVGSGPLREADGARPARPTQYFPIQGMYGSTWRSDCGQSGRRDAHRATRSTTSTSSTGSSARPSSVLGPHRVGPSAIPVHRRLAAACASRTPAVRPRRLSSVLAPGPRRTAVDPPARRCSAGTRSSGPRTNYLGPAARRDLGRERMTLAGDPPPWIDRLDRATRSWPSPWPSTPSRTKAASSTPWSRRVPTARRGPDVGVAFGGAQRWFDGRTGRPRPAARPSSCPPADAPKR